MFQRDVALVLMTWLAEKPPLSPDLTRQKCCFSRVYHLSGLAYLLLIKIWGKCSDILKKTKNETCSLPDNVILMKIYLQIKTKWQVLVTISTKICITLQRLRLVLPTSHLIDSELGCWLTSKIISQMSRALTNSFFSYMYIPKTAL